MIPISDLKALAILLVTFALKARPLDTITKVLRGSRDYEMASSKEAMLIMPWRERCEDDDDNGDNDDDHNVQTETTKVISIPIPHAYNHHERNWRIRWEQLQEFQRIHGHCNPSYRTDFTLAMWVKNQRMKYKYYCEGIPGKMPLHHVQLLNSIQFPWSAQDAKWMQMYAQLSEIHTKQQQQQQQQQHPQQQQQTVISSHTPLGRWVAQQRVRYRRATDDTYKTTSLSRPLRPDQIQLLNDISFVWSPREDVWWTRYEELREFVRQHGHCSIPQKYPPNPSLGVWCHHQRRACKEYILSCMIEQRVQGVVVSGLQEDRLQALREVKFCWLPEEPFSPPSADVLDSWYVTKFLEKGGGNWNAELDKEK
jgi:hypothetical protein